MTHERITAPAVRRLRDEMSEDGYYLAYLPANQAYIVTFGDYDGPRMKGPAPLRVIADWWEETNDQERNDAEPCYD